MKLLSNKRRLLLFVFYLFVEFGFAQFKTNTPIYNGALNQDKSKIALVDSERISVLTTTNLEPIWSLPYEEGYIISEISFAPSNDSVIIFRKSTFNGDLERNLDNTYYWDSLYVYNFVSKFYYAFSGNLFAAFAKENDEFCAFENQATEYSFQNKKYWHTERSTLFTSTKKNIPFNFPVLNCAMSSDGQKIGVIIKTSNSKHPCTLRVLNTQSLDVVFEQELPESDYTQLKFSEEGNSIYLESCRTFRKGMFEKYISDLGNVKDTIIPIITGKEISTEIFLGKQEFGLRLKPKEDEFVLSDVNSGKEQHVFWANACQLFNIRNAFILNENEIIVYGSFSDYTGPQLSGAANIIKLKDVSSFTQKDERCGSYQLFDPNEIKILPNVSRFDSDLKIEVRVGGSKKIAYLSQGRHLELWGVEDASLLKQFAFENNIQVHTDNEDSLLLVVEDHEEYDRTNFRLNVIDLHSGEVSFQIVSKEEVETYLNTHSFGNMRAQESEHFLRSVRNDWPWEIKKNNAVFDSFVKFDNAHHLLFEKLLINLQTLTNEPIKNFGQYVLLGDEYTGLGAELVTQNYWSVDDKSDRKKNTFFIVKNIAENGDTLAVSKRFKLDFETTYYKQELIASNTSKFICATVNEFFQDTDRDIYIFDIQKNDVREFLNVGLSSVVFSKNDSLFQLITTSMDASWNTTMKYTLYETQNFKKLGESDKSFFLEDTAFTKEIQQLNAPEYSLNAKYIQSVDGNKIFGFYKSGKMYVWKKGELSPHKTFSLGEGAPLICTFVGKNIFVGYSNRSGVFIDPNSERVVCSLFLSGNNDNTSILWSLPNGSFYAPKNTVANYHMVKQNKSYPLIAFDVLLNRPDQILSAIGLADDETIEIYKRAREKRMSKFKIPDINSALQVPMIEWGKNIVKSTKDSIVDFSVLVPTGVEKNARLHVLLNGIPLFGVGGIEIPHETKNYSFSATLEQGKNEVIAYVQNANGVVSLPISKEVTCEYSTVHRLHYFGIGVSDYADSTKNLTYAHSDILKLEEEFNSAFRDRISSTLLLNERATKEHILALRSQIKATGVNDIVVVAFAGHGTLGKDNEFYFCSHKINFSKPELEGVSYSEIEQLLDSIPSRKKLVLLDACHSGEIDSTEAPIFVQDLKPSKDKRGIDVVVAGGDEEMKELNKVSESLFANVNNSNGTFVIAASAGSEFAYETDKTGGVFTYSFIHAFNKNMYNWVNGPTIESIQKDTYDMVKTLTKGLQKPNSRSENFRYNWKFE